MKASSSVVGLGGLLLLACSPRVGRDGSGEFPRHGDYTLTIKDTTGERQLADVSIDGRTEKRLRRYITERLGLNGCSGRKLTIERGTLAARMRCRNFRQLLIDVADDPNERAFGGRGHVDRGKAISTYRKVHRYLIAGNGRFPPKADISQSQSMSL